MKIQIMGASGAGKTFLGNELAKVLNFIHIDTDDILWVWKDGVQPFTVPVPGEKGYKIFKEIFNDNENLITTGFFYPWGEKLIKNIDLLIYLTTSTEVRKERIIKREYELFGDRVDGDMK